jgi:hypothetical protein
VLCRVPEADKVAAEMSAAHFGKIERKIQTGLERQNQREAQDQFLLQCRHDTSPVMGLAACHGFSNDDHALDAIGNRPG